MMTNLSHEELAKAAQPLSDILQKHFNPNAIIIVTQNSVEILVCEMAAQLQVVD